MEKIICYRIALVGGEYPASDQMMVDTRDMDWVEWGGHEVPGGGWGEKLIDQLEEAQKKFNFIDEDYLKNICECEWNHLRKEILRIFYYNDSSGAFLCWAPGFQTIASVQIRGRSSRSRDGVHDAGI